MARKLINPKKIAFLVVNRDSFEYYDQLVNSKIKVSADVINNLEIIDLPKLDDLIISFINKNKISNRQLIIILNPQVYFEKNLDKEVNNDLEIQKFNSKVPLENITFKVIGNKNDSRLVVFNLELITAIKNFFEANGIKVILTTTKYDLDLVGINFRQKINSKSSNDLNNKIKILQSNNLSTEISPFRIKKFRFPSLKKINLNPTKLFAIIKKSSNLVKLIAIFSILVLILLVLFFIKKPDFNFPKAQPTPTPILVTPTPTAVPKTPETLTIKINYLTPRLAISTNNLKKQLTNDGYKNIIVEQDKKLGNSRKTIILFSTNTTPEIKNYIISTVGKFLINPVATDSSDIATDIQISVER